VNWNPASAGFLFEQAVAQSLAVNDLQSLKDSYDAAFDAYQMILTRNAQRASTTGTPTSADDCKHEEDARTALQSARTALVAALDPSEPQPPEI
jgi:hypothetical protein